MAAGEGQSVFLRDVALRGCPCSKTPSYTMLTQIALKGLGRFKKTKRSSWSWEGKWSVVESREKWKGM